MTMRTVTKSRDGGRLNACQWWRRTLHGDGLGFMQPSVSERVSVSSRWALGVLLCNAGDETGTA